jgi:hypothetical protein
MELAMPMGINQSRIKLHPRQTQELMFMFGLLLFDLYGPCPQTTNQVYPIPGILLKATHKKQIV